ncbi:PP0621 family protein [Roseateles sp. DC23W]|uniref:PP0621 family protein n=1 Tax=Pelomonas dachongensis TaxID=3299029 RepID=A0ABW7EKF9_9BURK
MKYVLLLAVLAILFFVLGAKRARGAKEREPEARRPAEPARPKAMLSCAECGMHLPADETLPGKGGVFCSAAHRASFESRQGPA